MSGAQRFFQFFSTKLLRKNEPLLCRFQSQKTNLKPTCTPLRKKNLLKKARWFFFIYLHCENQSDPDLTSRIEIAFLFDNDGSIPVPRNPT